MASRKNGTSEKEPAMIEVSISCDLAFLLTGSRELQKTSNAELRKAGILKTAKRKGDEYFRPVYCIKLYDESLAKEKM
jgi:hypothetical protein